MQIEKGILHWQNCSSKLSLSLINNNLILLIMIDLFFMGGPLFMGLLTIIFVLLIVAILMEFKGKSQFYSLSLIKEIGILALVVGLFGQLNQRVPGKPQATRWFVKIVQSFLQSQFLQSRLVIQ